MFRFDTRARMLPLADRVGYARVRSFLFRCMHLLVAAGLTQNHDALVAVESGDVRLAVVAEFLRS